MDNNELIKRILLQVKDNRLDKEIAYDILKELAKSKQAVTEFAIVGMSCEMPGATNLQEYWQMLKKGQNCVSKIPKARRDQIESYYGHTDFSFFDAAYLDQIDHFDAEYFKIPPRIAKEMDPYQRLLLQSLVEAIEDAGYTKEDLRGSSTGVFVGTDHTHKLVAAYLDQIESPDFTAMTGSWTAVLASRASYLFDFRGPAVVVDTACSSGLTALNQAMNAIIAGDCSLALVGAVNIFILPVKIGDGHIILEDVESREMKVKTFDRNADGTAWGEAVCSILIKPIDKAIADRDHIYAVIKSVCSNNDGASNGMSAPNPSAQERVILQAWKKAGIQPEQVDYVEAHGTGTVLGDPIEVKGLTAAFRKHTPKRQFCGIGSVKSNIGHTVGASGLASLIKVSLSLKHELLPPSINFSEPNPYISFVESPLYVQDKATDWKPGEKPRIAAINAFSINGTNCHAVIQEAPEKTSSQQSDAEGVDISIFTLSARNEELLLRTCENYLQFFNEFNDASLADVCYTANLGRIAYPDWRIAIHCRTWEELRASLQALKRFLRKQEVSLPENLYLNERVLAINGMSYPRMDAGMVASDENSRLCLAFIHNKELDWHVFYQGKKYNRVSLPPHPFKKDRFWLDGANTKSVTSDVEISLNLPAAMDEEETLLLQIVGEVLGYQTLTLNDDFYQLGGDSVTAVQVVNRLTVALQRQVSVSNLLNNPKLKELLRCLQSLPKDHIADEIKVAPAAPFYPLSSAQQRMYMAWNMVPQSIQYNVSAAVILHVQPEASSLKEAFTQIIGRHEIFRTTFHMIDGKPQQIVHGNSAVDFSTTEFSGNPDEERSWIANYMQDFIRPFNLEKGPLLRFSLLKLNGGRSLLCFDLHHIVTDGTTMGLLVHEMDVLLKGLPLQEVSLQYKDYVYWQQLKDLSASETYWLDQLSGELPKSELIPNRKSTQQKSHEGAVVSFKIETALMNQVKVFAQEQESTLFMVLLAALNVILSKFIRQQDIIIGTPVSGRIQERLATMMGIFINTLPLRNFPKGDISFAGFLKEVKTNTLAAYDHQDYPFDLLVEKLGVAREEGRNPLFNVLFELQNEDVALRDEANRELELIVPSRASLRFDFELSIYEAIDHLRCKVVYNDALFDNFFVNNLLGSLQQVLNDVVIDPTIKLGKINLLSPSDQFTLLTSFTPDSDLLNEKDTILGGFDEQVSQRPHAIALIFEDLSFTYQDLDRKSDTIASCLLHQGVKPGDTVGLLVNRHPDLVFSILAILKVGAVYVPLDPSFNPERLNFMIKDAGIEHIVSKLEFAAKVPQQLSTLLLDQLAEWQPFTGPAHLNRSDDPCYIMYTSGSTGNPKGVIIPHRSVMRLVKDTNYIQITERDRILQTGAPVFDATTFELWSSLLNGATLVMVDEFNLLNAGMLEGILKKEQISIMWLTVSLFNQLVNVNASLFNSLHYLLVGGDKLSPAHINKVLEANSQLKVINGYGPTENTTFSTTFAIDRVYESDIPIGKPIRYSTAYILDEGGNLLPPGALGELFVGGEGVAKGYLNLPELTAERFIDDPFHRKKGKMYRTGDLAIWQQDGNIRFMGRADNQVKIRGYRIEPGEVEHALLKHPAIQEALVMPETDKEGVKFLCAYFVAEQPLDAKEIRKLLQGIIPAFMLPSKYVQLDRFNLTRNGKLDRKNLSLKPEMEHREVAVEQEPNSLTQSVLAIWKKVLADQLVGTELTIDDNFFECGGQSLKAMEVVNEINIRHGIQLPLSVLFGYPTVRELTAQLKSLIDSDASQTPASKEETVKLLPKQAHYQLSSSQLRLFALHQANPGALAYNMPALFLTKTKLDKGALEQKFNRLIEKQEILRATYGYASGETVQFISDYLFWHLEEGEFLVEGEESIERAMDDFVRPFDLRKGPLLRAKLVHLQGNSEYCQALLIDMHHIISDGRSMDILLDELFGMGDEHISFMQYKEFAAWQAEFVSSAAGVKELTYWKNRLQQPLTSLSLPTDYLRPSTQQFQGNLVRFSFSAQVSKQIKGFIQGRQLTSQMFFLSAYFLLLRKFSRQDDIVVGVPVDGRSHRLFSRTIGMFVNTLPIRAQLPNGKKVADFFNEIRALSLEAYEHQRIPFDLIANEFKESRDASRNPLFDTMFVFQDTLSEMLDSVRQRELEPYPYKNNTSKFDLLLEGWDDGDELHFELEYNSSLFKKTSVAFILESYADLIMALVNNAYDTTDSIFLAHAQEEILPSANGKTDYKALSTPVVPQGQEDEEAALSNEEQVVAAIWKEILQLPSVRRTDNFFSLGGDSIRAIQIAARLQAKGMTLDVSRLFQHPRLCDAHLFVKPDDQQASQEVVFGEIPLTPIQHWFFSNKQKANNFFNQGVRIVSEHMLDRERVDDALRLLMIHHDALRIRFSKMEAAVVQVNLALEDLVSPLNYHDLSEMEDSVAEEAAILKAYQESRPLYDTNLFDALLFHHKTHDCLVLLAHHLIVDSVSWQLLIQDFMAIYSQLSAGEVAKLEMKTSSYQQWATSLYEMLHSKVFREQIGFWQAMAESVSSSSSPWPEAKAASSIGDMCYAKFVWDEFNTHRLSTQTSKAYGTDVRDILLTALLKTFHVAIGSQNLLVSLEGHGREELVEGLRLHRTVGWFTAIFPALLPLKGATLAEELISVKDYLRRIPLKGAGFGMLRYADEVLAPLLSALTPQVGFNYMGDISGSQSLREGITLKPLEVSESISSQSEQSMVLDINGFILEGKLQLFFTYNPSILSVHAMEQMLEHFEQYLLDLISHCVDVDRQEMTLSDYTAKDIDQEELDDLLNGLSLNE